MKLTLFVFFLFLSTFLSNEMAGSLDKTKEVMNSQELTNFVIKEPKDLDLILDSFCDTRDKKFLIKALEAINKNEKALIIGYEFNNRRFLNQLSTFKFPFDDLWAEIADEEKLSPGFKDQVMVAGSGIWALESLKQQDPRFAQLLGNICKEQPNLDYLKKINRFLGVN